MLELASSFATIVGLIGLWKSDASARKSSTLQDFTEWLRRHQHEQLVNLFQDNQQLAQAVRQLVENQHQEVMEKLASLDATLSSVAANLNGFNSLARIVQSNSHISQQAVSLLHQMNEANASRFIEIKTMAGTTYQTVDGGRVVFSIDEPRFVEDDLCILVDLGLLLESVTPKGTRVFTITRAGAAVGGETRDRQKPTASVNSGA